MTSFKGRMFNFMMRNRHLTQGKLKKPVFTMESSIRDFRDLCEKGASRYASIPEGLEVKEETMEGIRSEWLIPSGADPEKVVPYVHGGGYVSGSCSDHRGFVSKFAKQTGVANLVFEYRLAPEFTYPAIGKS